MLFGCKKINYQVMKVSVGMQMVNFRKLASEWKKFSLKELGIATSMIAKSTRIVLNGLKRKGKLIQ
ncbi:hypothetical protein Hanom_Chr16g01516411 [Helianthus anomalus]